MGGLRQSAPAIVRPRPGVRRTGRSLATTYDFEGGPGPGTSVIPVIPPAQPPGGIPYFPENWYPGMPQLPITTVPGGQPTGLNIPTSWEELIGQGLAYVGGGGCPEWMVALGIPGCGKSTSALTPEGVPTGQEDPTATWTERVGSAFSGGKQNYPEPPYTIGQGAMVDMVAEMRCPRGWILSHENRCYPPQMITRAARKWKPRARPIVSAAEGRMITKANNARKRLVAITKKSGAHASMTKPRPRAKAPEPPRIVQIQQE